MIKLNMRDNKVKAKSQFCDTECNIKRVKMLTIEQYKNMYSLL